MLSRLPILSGQEHVETHIDSDVQITGRLTRAPRKALRVGTHVVIVMEENWTLWNRIFGPFSHCGLCGKCSIQMVTAILTFDSKLE